MMKLGKSKRKGNFEDWHDLRIVTKKMRYTAEFFAALFPGDQSATYNKQLAIWQDRLGELNDIAVSESLLQTRRFSTRTPLAASFSIAASSKPCSASTSRAWAENFGGGDFMPPGVRDRRTGVPVPLYQPSS